MFLDGFLLLCVISRVHRRPAVLLCLLQLVDITDEGFCELMIGDSGETKADLTLPNGEIGDIIKKNFDNGAVVVVSVISAMGEEAIVGSKVDGKAD